MLKNIFQKSSMRAPIIILSFAVISFLVVALPANAQLSGVLSSGDPFTILCAGLARLPSLVCGTSTYPIGTGSAYAPYTQTNYANSINQTSAVFNGAVNPNNDSTSYYFEYGTTPSLDNRTLNSSVGSGNYSVAVNSNVYNLIPNTTYYFRVVAQNNYGTSYGQILNFVASNGGGQIITGQLPTALTRNASGVSQNSAVLNAEISPNGNLTTTWFDYGTTPLFDSRTEFQTMGSNFGSATQSLVVSNLSPNTLYYFRAAAQNSFGVNYGSTLSFRTGPTVAIGLPQPTPTVTTRTIIQRIPITTTSTGTSQVLGASNGDDISCFMVVPVLSPVSPSPGQEFVFTITYKNGCEVDFSNATAKIILPVQVEFRSTNLPYTLDGGNTLTYNIGPVFRNVESVMVVHGIIKTSAQPGDTLVFSGLINFNDNNGRFRSVGAYLSDAVGQKIGGSSLASLFSVFSGWGLWLILLLFLLLLILFLVYYFASERKHQDSEYNKMLEEKMQAVPPAKP